MSTVRTFHMAQFSGSRSVDLLFLVLDLGDPLRFHYMLRVFKPSAPMSLGT